MVTLLMELAQPYRKDRKTQEVTQFSFWLVANSGPRWGESLSKARLSVLMTRASDVLNGSVHLPSRWPAPSAEMYTSCHADVLPTFLFSELRYLHQARQSHRPPGFL